MRPWIALLFCLPAAAASAGPADLDPAFGFEGKLIVDYTDAPSPRTTPLLGLGGTPQGFSALETLHVAEENSVHVFLSRFAGNGDIDGIVDLGIAAIHAGGSAFLPDGRVLLAAAGYLGNDQYELRIHRFRADGTPDPTFGGGDGVVSFLDTSGNPSPNALALAADGSIAVTGYFDPDSSNVQDGSDRLTFVARATAEGVPITAFGADGFVQLDIVPFQAEGPRALAVLADGQVLLCDRGEFGGQFDALLTRVRSTGTIDTYASGGSLYYDTSVPNGPDQQDHCMDIDVQPGTGATLMTMLRIGGSSDMAVRRVPVDAAGNAGVAFDNIVGSRISAARLDFDSQGRALLSALARTGAAAPEFRFVRFGALGAPDIQFGLGGTASHVVRVPNGVTAAVTEVGNLHIFHDARGRIVAGAGFDVTDVQMAGWSALRLQGDAMFADGFE